MQPLNIASLFFHEMANLGLFDLGVRLSLGDVKA
jgi:hypothetical protein